MGTLCVFLVQAAMKTIHSTTERKCDKKNSVLEPVWISELHNTPKGVKLTYGPLP